VIRHLVLPVIVLTGALGCRDKATRDAATEHYGLGRPATSAEIATRDVDVGPDGAGLPPGHGSVAEGVSLYAAKCASCHGPEGQGQLPTYPRLIGRDSIAEGFPFARDPRLVRTIGNYWPYATSLFDYVRRAMPQLQPGSLTDDQVYAITAFLLSRNAVIPSNATLDSATLAAVKMPYVGRFVADDRRGGREVK